MRERWFGATGRRVPELALEGEWSSATPWCSTRSTTSRSCATAFDAGRPVVVRASSAEQIKAALARPEVACVVVPDDRPELLDLDLTELTYG